MVMIMLTIITNNIDCPLQVVWATIKLFGGSSMEEVQSEEGNAEKTTKGTSHV